MAQNIETKAVQNPALLAAGSRPDVLIWRQQSGLFRAYDDPRRVVRVGTPGMSDAMAVVAVTVTPEMVGNTIGVAVAPEFKTATGKQRQRQADWQAAFQARGGVYAIVRTPAEMTALIERVQHGPRR